MAENITFLSLMYVPLDNEYKHTLYFSDIDSRDNYFLNVTPRKTFTDFSYQVKDSKLRVNLSFDEALKYNYVMYQNQNYSNKGFYAFITNYEWKSEDVTELTIETDVIQTWMFDIEIMPSFIEREHTKDDTIGLNTIPENVEMGEYIVHMVNKVSELQECYIVVACTEPSEEFFGEQLPTAKALAGGGLYNGIYSGLCYYRFGTETADINILNTFLASYSDSSAIKAIFLYPKSFIDAASVAQFVQKTAEPTSINHVVNKEIAYTYTGMDGYKPKNNKLLTYPYIYLLVSNNNGGSAIYQYEHFTDSTGQNKACNFKIESALTPGGSIRLIPLRYKGITENNEEGLNLGKYPICNWTSDEYTNWLTQNSVNIGMNLVSGLGQIIAGGAIAIGSGGLGTAVGGSGIVSGVSTITNQIAQIHQMSFTPPQSNGNINCGDVITASKENTFTFYQMSIKAEYMRYIDEYFSVYGYKSNRIKVPYKNHRENWWFTKTVDANITGQIPIADMKKIKECYNNGITFWREASNIKNYSLSNNII